MYQGLFTGDSNTKQPLCLNDNPRVIESGEFAYLQAEKSLFSVTSAQEECEFNPVSKSFIGLKTRRANAATSVLF